MVAAYCYQDHQDDESTKPTVVEGTIIDSPTIESPWRARIHRDRFSFCGDIIIYATLVVVGPLIIILLLTLEFFDGSERRFKEAVMMINI